MKLVSENDEVLLKCSDNKAKLVFLYNSENLKLKIIGCLNKAIIDFRDVTIACDDKQPEAHKLRLLSYSQ